MPKNKARKESGKATLASIKKEMAKPRVAKSARKKYGNLTLPGGIDRSRKSAQPRTN